MCERERERERERDRERSTQERKKIISHSIPNSVFSHVFPLSLSVSHPSALPLSLPLSHPLPFSPSLSLSLSLTLSLSLSLSLSLALFLPVYIFSLSTLVTITTLTTTGPLRLLAWEIREKLSSEEVPCDLLTGQEREVVPDSSHVSSTVEMTDVTRPVECAVIDEFQMIADRDRGHAWTRAFLGLIANEIHVCGEPRMVPLLKELCSITGDTLEIQTYDRLCPLEFSSPVSSIRDLKRGDCIVAFSRKDIYAIKSQIERESRFKCCVVYGSLPPETRKLQAQLFNDPHSGFDILVASDAVGMGLNLNIGRMVFSSLEKFDGSEFRYLNSSEVRQIAGRAGRFGTEFHHGHMTCLDEYDMTTLMEQYNGIPTDIDAAALFPPFEILERFAHSAPDYSFSKLLKYFYDFAMVDGIYFHSDVTDMAAIADELEGIKLSIRDRYTFCMAPVKSRTDIRTMELMKIWAEDFASPDQHVRLRVRVPSETNIPQTAEQLQSLERLHSSLDVYIWLGNRYEDAFVDMAEAKEKQELVCGLIQDGLKEMGQKGLLRRRERGKRGGKGGKKKKMKYKNKKQ